MEYNIYCDESCHLQNDNSDIMVIGSIWCEKEHIKQCNQEIRQLKQKHGLSSWFEIKWTKVSPAKFAFYEELLDYFINNKNLHYRGIIAQGKKKLDHDVYNNGDYDLWYYKMYFLMLDWIIKPMQHYNIFMDIKDTNGGKRVRKLKEVLSNNIYDFNGDCVRKVVQVDSKESELLQLGDFISGALSHYNRFAFNPSSAKGQIIHKLNRHYHIHTSSTYSNMKFNIFYWEGRH